MISWRGINPRVRNDPNALVAVLPFLATSFTELIVKNAKSRIAVAAFSLSLLFVVTNVKADEIHTAKLDDIRMKSRNGCVICNYGTVKYPPMRAEGGCRAE